MFDLIEPAAMILLLMAGYFLVMGVVAGRR